jgi:hypothetical protein
LSEIEAGKSGTQKVVAYDRYDRKVFWMRLRSELARPIKRLKYFCLQRWPLRGPRRIR